MLRAKDIPPVAGRVHEYDHDAEDGDNGMAEVDDASAGSSPLAGAVGL